MKINEDSNFAVIQTIYYLNTEMLFSIYPRIVFNFK